MEEIAVTGMVLAVMPIGDYDRRLTILTKEKGKIAAFAKGARKPTSALLACSQPFTFGTFVLYEGRSSYTVTRAEVTNYFSEIREDFSAVYYGMYFCEFAAHVTREELPAVEELKLLYCSLRALTKASIGMELVRAVFELKLMQILGNAPQLHACVRCGKEQEVLLFSAAGGGVVCTQCMAGADSIRISESTLYTMQYILSAPYEKLYTFTVSAKVLAELKQCMKRFLRVHIDCEMKALELLEQINGESGIQKDLF